MAAKDEFEPRRATPGAVYGYTDRSGKQIEMRADDEGIVRPDSADEVAVLDGYDLPVARKALAAEKAAKKAAKKEND